MSDTILEGPESPTHPDCARCPAYCCRDLDVHVTAHDIHRICAALTLPAESFVRLTTTPGATSTPDSFLLSGAGPEYELVLDRRQRSCLFLLQIDEAGRARCGIYEHRPMVCRGYPFFPSADPDLVTLSIDARALCPPPLLHPAKVPGADVLPTLLRKQVERDIHRLAIDRWNRWIAAYPPPASASVSPAAAAPDSGTLLGWLLTAAVETLPLLAPILEDADLGEAWTRRAAEAGNPLLPRPNTAPGRRGPLDVHLVALKESVRRAPLGSVSFDPC